MEKQIANSIPPSQRGGIPGKRPMASALVISVCVGLLLLGGLLPRASRSPLAYPTVPFNLTTHDPWDPWGEITPSTKLQWRPCYKFLNPTFQCARLTVPLDYNQPARASGAGEVHIALVLLPAKNATAALASPRSPLLINPGGPGGPGTLAALLMGESLQTVLGDDQAVIGFDPRGIAFTTPQANCWVPPAECDGCPPNEIAGLTHRLAWMSEYAVYGSINSSNVALKFLDAGARAVNDLCRAKHASLGGASILSHASTAHVARDMVSIVDAWEEWVDEEASSQGITPAVNPTRGKLVYWGFSYGTFLGSLFASLFPDRVGRLLLDGVVDADFYVSDMWDESLYDADRVLGRFFSYCADARSACHFYRAGDSPESIERRYHALLSRLDEHPATFTHPVHFFPVLLRAEVVRRVVFSTLYSPVQGFPILAVLLNMLHEEAYAQFSQFYGDTQAMCNLPTGPISYMISDAGRAIMCGDKTRPVNMTLSQVRAHFETMSGFSAFADIWVDIMLDCEGWDISKPHSPSPPPLLSSSRKDQVITDFPILFLSNTYDPVTPLIAAVKMALRFRRAGLLEQKSEGHCTVAAVSRCTARVVHDYVRYGKVPPPPEVDGDDYLGGTWTTCEADERPWKKVGEAGGMQILQEEREMVAAMENVRDVMAAIPRWGSNRDLNVQKLLKILGSNRAAGKHGFF